MAVRHTPPNTGESVVHKGQKVAKQGVAKIQTNILHTGECKNICVSGILNLLKGNVECQYQTNLSINC